MEEQKYNYGMIGLGTMGSNLVLNMCDHGYTVAGYDKDEKQVARFTKEVDGYKAFGTSNLAEFLKALSSPRIIILLVPAGKIVDLVIEELKPFLSANDILLDCGNSHFTDTNQRIAGLSNQNINFMGVGVSGGEAGARYGPSIMPGGSESVYKNVSGMFDDIAAKVNGEPCVTYLGPGSAGHYVKMVHNGIEYGLMQLISEAYHLLKTLTGLNNIELHELFEKWNAGQLNSFLIEITADIFSQKDEFTNADLIDMILDSARQKGTGKWASQDAMDLNTPIPAIDAAVTARELSDLKNERVNAQKILIGGVQKLEIERDEFMDLVGQALYFSMITTYAQGMALLYHASIEYKYNLNLHDVAKIWRGGCIIRSSFLENIRSAYASKPDLVNLMISEKVSSELIQAQEGIRKMVVHAVNAGIPVPAMMASLAYFDSYRSAWLPSNLLQAQRDFFGAHTYQRVDREGVFHTQWNQKN